MSLDCYIYVIGREQGPVKVGISADPGLRLRGLQTGCPFGLKLLYARRMRNRKHAEEHEADFLACHPDYHIRGEWYRCDAEIAIEGIDGGVEVEEYFESLRDSSAAGAV